MITYCTFTDKGDREINEDSVGVFDNGDKYCFVVCDGLGGHGRGEVASALVVDVLMDQFYKSEELVNFIGQALETAQHRLTKKQMAENKAHEMKTTVVVMAIDENMVYIGHVGDSRLYVFVNGRLKRKTTDHSVPGMLAMTREIRDDEIRGHPDRNLLLRVMGVEWEEPMYEMGLPVQLKKGMAFLLCTDGFWEYIDEATMRKTLKKSRTPEQWRDAMAEIVRHNGMGNNMDNFSAVAVFCK